MRALPLLRALALTVSALLASGACSLMAPTDEELLGAAARSPNAKAGAAANGSSRDGVSGGGLGGRSSGAGDAPEGGEGASLGLGGEGSGGSPDFSALIPQEGLALWLMADHGIGEAEGGGVAIWADFSLNEADAKQSISSLQPKLLPKARGLLPLVEFDGADDQLSLVGDFTDFSAGLSAFIIASASSEQSCPSLLQLSNEPEHQDIEIGRYSGAAHYEVADDDVAGPSNSFGVQQLVLVGVVHAPTKSPELRLNGMYMETGSFTALPEVMARTNNFIGRSLYKGCEPFHGRVGEIILYARALDSAERLAVESYLQSRWSYEPPVKTKPGPGEIPAAQ